MERDNVIKEIEEKDLMELKQIQKDVFNKDATNEQVKEFYEIYKNSKNIHTLGYYIKDKLVGTVTLNILTLPYGKEATIWNVSTIEKYRRLGIATKLMNKAEEIARRENVIRIWLFSGFHRAGAHQLYRKLGYDENRDKAFVKTL